MKYIELHDRPINPNKAKYWALLLSAVAALIALMTCKSNWDYFAQYYQGFAFWSRVIVFYSVEAAIIILPLAKGWGNRPQIFAALIFDVVLITLSLIHTSFVGDVMQAKLVATKTKAEASADFDRTQQTADKVAAQNARLQENHNLAMARWNRLASIAQANNQAPPLAPAAPQLMAVPQVSQATVDAAAINIEQAGEARVDHTTLLRLLYAMLATVVLSAITLVWLANSSKIKDWLLKQQAAEIQEMTAEVGSARVIDMGHSPAPPASAIAQEPRRVAGFSQTSRKTPQAQTPQTPKDCIGVSELKTIRQRLKSVSAQNPGMSFKVDGRGQQLYIRAMRSEQGAQVTEATLRLTETETKNLIAKPESECQRDLVSRFASQNLRLNS